MLFSIFPFYVSEKGACVFNIKVAAVLLKLSGTSHKLRSDDSNGEILNRDLSLTNSLLPFVFQFYLLIAAKKELGTEKEHENTSRIKFSLPPLSKGSMLKVGFSGSERLFLKNSKTLMLIV